MGLVDPPSRKLTYADYLEFPRDGRRHEILDGEHVVSPSPSWDHQRAQDGILVQLTQQIETTGLGWVVSAPMDVRLSEFDIVQPDVLALDRSQGNLIRSRFIEGAPALAIEILSPSTATRDRTAKLDAYDRCGVSEVWLIDTAERHAERFNRSADGRWTPDGLYHHRLPSKVLSNVEVDLDAIWTRLRQ